MLMSPCNHLKLTPLTTLLSNEIRVSDNYFILYCSLLVVCILSFFGKQEIYQIFSTGNGDWRSKKITSILVSKTHTDRIQLSYLMTERNYTARNRGCLNFRLDMNLNWSKRAGVCANFDGISFWGYAPVFSRRVFYQHGLTPKNHEVKSTSAKLFSLLKPGKTKCGLCVQDLEG